MPFVVPADVEILVANRLASGAYNSSDEVLRSAMNALTEVDADLEAVLLAVRELQSGDQGTPLIDAVQQVRDARKHGTGNDL